MSLFLLSAALLLSASPSSAAGHKLVVRVSDGAKSYAHTATSAAGAQTNFAGKVNGQDMIVNALFTESRGSVRVQYQLELARPDRSRNVQAQADVRMRPGDRLTAVSCGA